jgi:hypothetical protein
MSFQIILPLYVYINILILEMSQILAGAHLLTLYEDDVLPFFPRSYTFSGGGESLVWYQNIVPCHTYVFCTKLLKNLSSVT